VVATPERIARKIKYVNINMFYLLFPLPNPFLAFLRIFLSKRRLPLLNFKALEALIPHHIILLQDERHVYSVNYYTMSVALTARGSLFITSEKCTMSKEAAAAVAAASEDA